MEKYKKKSNIIHFPKKKSKLKREIEAIIFSAEEPLDLETIEKIFNEETKEDEPLGNDPSTGDEIWIKKGPYGHYVQIGETKKRKGIPKTFSLSEVDLDYALKL